MCRRCVADVLQMCRRFSEFLSYKPWTDKNLESFEKFGWTAGTGKIPNSSIYLTL